MKRATCRAVSARWACRRPVSRCARRLGAEPSMQLFRVACTFESEEPVPRLGQEVAAHLFRIAQEAVNNAVTHGRAERIEISLRGTDGEGRLSVRDNGVGLPDEARQGGGIGLHTMAYRARLIGGSLEVRRRTPRGTAVTCVFPLPATPETTDPGPCSHRQTKPGPPARKTILIVDDHPVLRRGLAALIESEPDLAVCGEAATCRGRARGHPPAPARPGDRRSRARRSRTAWT